MNLESRSTGSDVIVWIYAAFMRIDVLAEAMLLAWTGDAQRRIDVAETEK